MTAAQLPLTIERGGDLVFSVQVSGGPTSLSGFTGAMQIRSMKEDPTALYTLDPSQVTFDSVNGIVSVRIPAADTADFSWTVGVYDVVITNGSETWRIAEGRIKIDQWVTREGA